MIIILYFLPLLVCSFLGLIYSGPFIILLSIFILKIINLFIFIEGISSEAYYYLNIEQFILFLALLSLIFYKKLFSKIQWRVKRYKDDFLSSITLYAHNKSLLFKLLISQITFILIVFILSSDLDILSYNRTKTIALTVPGIRYIYPFFIGLSPAICSGSIMSIINLKEVRNQYIHYLLIISSFICVFLIGQRGYFMYAIFISIFGSFLFSLYRIFYLRINFNVVKYWFFLLLVPLVYNLRNLLTLFTSLKLKNADLLILKAWEASIEITAVNEFQINTFFNNIFSFLPHTLRIDLNLMRATDLVNSFLFGEAYYSDGFGLNVTLPMDLYISLGGNKNLWLISLFISYFVILVIMVKLVEYFLFRNKCFLGFIISTYAIGNIFASIGSWPISTIFILQAFLLMRSQKFNFLESK